MYSRGTGSGTISILSYLNQIQIQEGGGPSISGMCWLGTSSAPWPGSLQPNLQLRRTHRNLDISVSCTCAGIPPGKSHSPHSRNARRQKQTLGPSESVWQRSHRLIKRRRAYGIEFPCAQPRMKRFGLSYFGFVVCYARIGGDRQVGSNSRFPWVWRCLERHHDLLEA